MDERWGCGDDSDVSDGGDKWAGVGIGGGCKCAGSKSAGGSEPAGKGMGGRGNSLGVMSDSSGKCAGRGVDGEGAGNELGSESERTDEGKVLCGENTWDELDDAMIGRVEVEEVGIRPLVCEGGDRATAIAAADSRLFPHPCPGLAVGKTGPWWWLRFKEPPLPVIIQNWGYRIVICVVMLYFCDKKFRHGHRDAHSDYAFHKTKSQAKSTNLRVQGVQVFSGTGAGSHGYYKGMWQRRGDSRGCVETAPVRVEVRDIGGSVVVGSGGCGGRVEVAAAWWGRGGSRSRVSEVEGCRSNVEGGRQLGGGRCEGDDEATTVLWPTLTSQR
ncbi:hypothetical protein EDB84DRAFT_1444430 [Lactarius hengduanensis]|nr:hypothetical protein EDB84DRAFT_1444430 [Lactarius hengduanensis]